MVVRALSPRGSWWYTSVLPGGRCVSQCDCVKWTRNWKGTIFCLCLLGGWRFSGWTKIWIKGVDNDSSKYKKFQLCFVTTDIAKELKADSEWHRKWDHIFHTPCLSLRKHAYWMSGTNHFFHLFSRLLALECVVLATYISLLLNNKLDC